MADAATTGGNGAPDASLREHREAIDALDREILARLSERATHAKAIGALKADSGAPAAATGPASARANRATSRQC